MANKKTPDNYYLTDFYYINRPEGNERRRYRRFHCREGIITFLNGIYGRVQNISLGGLSFSSIIKEKDPAPEKEIGKKRKLDIVFGRHQVIASGLSGEVVYNYQVPHTENDITRNCYRRYYGIRFSGLSARQDFKLKSLILKGCYFRMP